MAATLSDEDLRARIEAIMAHADMSTTTVRSVRRELEAQLGYDLEDRKAFIRETVNELYDAIQAAEEPPQPEVKTEVKEEPADEANGGDSAGESSESSEEPSSSEEDDAMEVDEKPAKRTSERKKDVKKESKGKKDKPKRSGGGRGGFSGQLLELSPELAALVKAPAMARTQVVKAIWEHIRAHNLQDPSDKRHFFCDEAMFNVFRTKRVHMFGMNKILSRHFVGASSKSGDADPSSKRKREDDGDDGRKKARTSRSDRGGKVKSSEYVNSGSEVESDGQDMTDEALARRLQDEERGRGLRRRQAEVKTKRRTPSSKGDGEKKKSSGGLNKPLALSEKLSALVGASEMSRPQVVKAIWTHIKAHDLQDPQNKRYILCDDKLRAVFGCDRVHMCGMNKLLGAHVKDKEFLAP